jgi:outer membrane protein assembly factor BamB
MFNPRERSRPITLFVFLCFGCFLLCGVARAAPSINLSEKSGPPTSRILVSGKGFGPYDAIDIYFDTKDEALALADSSGAFSKIPIQVPASALPGQHWVSAVQRGRHTGAQVSFRVNTNWNQFHFTPNHKGLNPYENVLFPSTVPRMDLQWSFPTVGQVELAPAEAEGVLYVGAGFHVYALNADTGVLLWKYSGCCFVGGPAVADGEIFVSSADNNTYALNAKTGTLLWAYHTGNTLPTTPTVAAGIVYVGSSDKNVYALSAKTGALVWKYLTSGSVFSTPAVANGAVYFGSDDDNVYALNASTGSLLWLYSTGYFVDSPPTVVDGVVYVGSFDHNVYALNASNGALIWQYSTGNVERTSPAVVEGIVYVTSDGGLVYALNANTGKLVWEYDTGSGDNGFPPSSPSVANGVVYAGFQDSKIYALDATTGGSLWQYVTGGAITSTPAVVNGTVYTGSWDNNVYAFGLAAVDEARRGAQHPDLRTLRPSLNLKPSPGTPERGKRNK